MALSIINVLQAHTVKVPALGIERTDREYHQQFEIGIAISCKSLGDLLKVPVLLYLLKNNFSRSRLVELDIEEEYHDFSTILQVLRDKYVDSTPCSDGVDEKRYVIGCYDSSVIAYNNQEGDYDFLFPAQLLRALNVKAYSDSELEEIRRALNIDTDQKVIVLSSFSITKKLNLKGLSERVKKDFIDSNQARYVDPDLLCSAVQFLQDSQEFDIVYMVPRNVTEEMKALDYVKNRLNGYNLKESTSKEAVNKGRNVIVDAKGVLSAIYAIADCAVVFGQHNMLEPFLANPQCLTLCFEPPRESPNRAFWECGDRLKLCKSIGPLCAELKSDEITKHLNTMCSPKSDRSDYYSDSLFKNSYVQSLELINELCHDVSMRF